MAAAMRARCPRSVPSDRSAISGCARPRRHSARVRRRAGCAAIFTSPRVRADTPIRPPPTCRESSWSAVSRCGVCAVNLIVDRDIDRDAAVLGADPAASSLVDPAERAADDQRAHARLDRPRFGAQHVVAEAGQVLGHRIGQVERDGAPEARRPLLARDALLAAIQRKPEARIQGDDPGRERELADQDRVRVRRRSLRIAGAAGEENRQRRRPAHRGGNTQRQVRTHRPSARLCNRRAAP